MTYQFEVEFRGGAKLVKALEEVPEVVEKEVQEAMKKALSVLQEKVADYPPAQPSRYVRTGTLGRSWSYGVEKVGAEFVGRLGTPVEYAPLVQGPIGVQAGRMMHRGWQGVDRILAAARGRIEGILVGVVRRVAERIGR